MRVELVGSVEQLSVRHRVERVENEQGRGRALTQLSAAGLTPVPTSTRHTGVVAPHHLTGVGMLHDVGSAGGRIEGLLTGRPNEPGRPDVAGRGLPHQWEVDE